MMKCYSDIRNDNWKHQKIYESLIRIDCVLKNRSVIKFQVPEEGNTIAIALQLRVGKKKEKGEIIFP